MPQDRESGERGRRSGFENADRIGEEIGATRIGHNSNEFQWGERRILIKSGDRAAVVTRALLARVDAIVFGIPGNHNWALFEIDPETFERISGPSRSTGHNEDYRSVGARQLQENGQEIHR